MTDPLPPLVGGWRRARVMSISHPTERSVQLRLQVPDRIEHLPGQHYVLRLTAEDGYVAQRSYSVASAPADSLIELYVERLVDGEVSGFLAEIARVDDVLHVRGPIGGWFAWDGRSPAVGIGGGSGVVPLVAMVRHAVDTGHPDRFAMVAAARTLADLPYADEVIAAGAHLALSRSDYRGRPAGRLGVGDLDAYVRPAATYFICGGSGFAEAATMALLDVGVPVSAIRVERFGPSGD